MSCAKTRAACLFRIEAGLFRIETGLFEKSRNREVHLLRLFPHLLKLKVDLLKSSRDRRLTVTTLCTLTAAPTLRNNRRGARTKCGRACHQNREDTVVAIIISTP